MRVFIYEYMTATGIGRDPASPEHGMYLEGAARCATLAEDFARVPGVEIVTLDQFEEDDREHEIWRAAEECAWSVIISPETDGQLDRDCWAIHYSASQLLGASVVSIRLTSDKLLARGTLADAQYSNPQRLATASRPRAKRFRSCGSRKTEPVQPIPSSFATASS